MRRGTGRHAAAAVWLGLLALAFNALVPVHLAFDLEEALASSHRLVAGGDAVERGVLALLSGHGAGEPEPRHDGTSHGHSHRTACPVCNALGALSGFAVPPAAPVVALPSVAAGLPAALPMAAIRPAGVAAAYRSRAPPAV
jgi:Protein of unknown function (DUF2946)